MRTDGKIVSAMKRPPRPGEPDLIHTTNSGRRQTVALVPENFNPKILDVIEKNLAQIPGIAWAVLPHDTGFTVLSAAGDRISENHVQRVGESIELETTLLAGAGGLTRSELIILADLEQCVAIILGRWPH